MPRRKAMRKAAVYVVLVLTLLLSGCVSTHEELKACAELVNSGFRPVAKERTGRFMGKVQEATAICRGGDKAVEFRKTPYVDWSNYWATGDSSTMYPGTDAVGGHLYPNGRGIDGALLDLEYQRMELIKFNLFDNSGTYREYIEGRGGVAGPALKVWKEMRLPKDNPNYEAVGGDGPQVCKGELIRSRNLDGTCNDIKNPLMGSTNRPFARNAQFEATFPDLGKNDLARNRHGDRLGLLKPDPQVISRKLFTRSQSQPDKCREGEGLPG